MIKSSFDPTLPLRYLLYGRMSDEKQNPRSPDQQFDEINRTKNAQGRGNWVFVKSFRDNGISGRYYRKRPGFRQMLDGIRSGLLKVDAILVDTLERFGRLKGLQAVRDELRTKYGVLILTADTGFTDPTSVVGQVYGTLEAIRAQSAAGEKAHDVLRGKIDAAMMKRWPGGPPNCGYKLAARTETLTRRNGKTLENVHHVLVPDPATVEIPRRIYQLAYDHCWGRHRIAKVLNADVDFITTFGKINYSLVGSILQNTIYKGLFRFNFRATDIQDDCHISQENNNREVIYVEGFCEGIVHPELVDKVHADFRRRSEQSQQQRAANKVDDGKQIQPVIHGVSLVYPLSGLVRCAKCNASMQPTKSGSKTKLGNCYHYYRCPCASDDRCPNKIYLPGGWLWEVVVARLRELLFPLGHNGKDTYPTWLSELIAEVRCSLEARLEQDPDRQPMLENESNDLDSKVAGWTETLSKRDLSSLVRDQVEQQLNLALERKQKIAVELEMRTNANQHVSSVLDPDKVVERLSRLADVLATGNPSDVNEELAKHIESIAVQPGGAVVMRTSRLGLFEGAAEILASGGRGDAGEEDSEPGVFKILPRELPRRRTTGPVETSALAKPSGVIERMVALPDQWVDEAIFTMPTEKSFAKKHAEAVYLRRQAGKLSYAKLAAEFGVTAPTCRAAVKHYLATHPSVSDGVKLRPGGKRPAKFDVSKFGNEARALWETGWSKLKLADKFACSPPTIDKALVWAYEQDGLPVPTRPDTKGAKIVAARAALDGGNSLDEIAKMLKVSDVTAREFLRESFAAEDKPMPDLRSRRRKS